MDPAARPPGLSARLLRPAVVRSLARAQLFHYALGTAIVMLARSAVLVGLARLLFPSEYGQLNLLLTTVGLLLPLATLGVPQAAVRYFQQYQQQGRMGALSAALLVETTGGAVLVCAGLLAVGVLALRGPDGGPQWFLLLAGAVILFCSSLTEASIGLDRAAHRAFRFALSRIAQVAGGGALGILAVLLLERAGQAYVWGQAVAEFSVAGVLLLWVIRRSTMPAMTEVRRVMAQTLRYGVPHVLILFASLLLSTGNRYIVGWLLGDSAVGTYVFGFLIASSVMSALNVPLNLFLFPSYMRRWHQSGPEAVARFLSHSADLYLMVAIPLVIVGTMVSGRVVLLFGTETYADAAEVVPFLLAGFAFYGLFLITAAPLYAQDKVSQVGVITLVSAVGNLLLSVGLVHWLGTRGAALSCLVSFALHQGVVAVSGARLLRVPWKRGEAALYVILGCLLWLVSQALPGESWYVELAYAVLFFPVFFALVYALSSDKRQLIQRALRQ